MALVPPAGAVQQFKVGTASFDAADGHTAGASINATLKSGTNSLKGESCYPCGATSPRRPTSS